MLIIVSAIIPAATARVSIENEVIETMDLSGVTAIVLTEEVQRNGNSLLMDGEVMLQSANTFSERDFDRYDIILAEYNALANNPRTLSLLEDLFVERGDRDGKVFGMFSTKGTTTEITSREIVEHKEHRGDMQKEVIVHTGRVWDEEHHSLRENFNRLTGKKSGSPITAYVIDYRSNVRRTSSWNFEDSQMSDIIDHMYESIMEKNEESLLNSEIPSGWLHLYDDDHTDVNSDGTMVKGVSSVHVLKPSHASWFPSDKNIFLVSRSIASRSEDYEKTEIYCGPYFRKIEHYSTSDSDYSEAGPSSFEDGQGSATFNIGAQYFAGVGYSRTWPISDVSVYSTGTFNDIFYVKSDYRKPHHGYTIFPFWSSPAFYSHALHEQYYSNIIQTDNRDIVDVEDRFAVAYNVRESIHAPNPIIPLPGIITTLSSVNRHFSFDIQVDARPSTPQQPQSILNKDDGSVKIYWPYVNQAEYDSDAEYNFIIIRNNQVYGEDFPADLSNTQFINGKLHFVFTDDSPFVGTATYRIKAFSRYGESGLSNHAFVDLRPKPPTISGVRNADHNGNAIHHISWNHDNTQHNNFFTIDRYNIYRRSPGSSSYIHVASRYPSAANSNGVITYQVTAPAIGTYYYRVRTAVPNNVGGSLLSINSNTVSLVGSGGGGCPYVSVWNGEEYVHDNNILIASEHQPGVVDDNYILQNTMVPKDGYYSLKIEEFEHSQDFFDTFSLYTIDHREGYSVGTTPDYEYITYKNPVPPESAYDGYGQDVLEYVSDPDSEPVHMPEGSSVVLNYGVMGNALWEHQKLVVRSHGFESYTEQYLMNSNPSLMLHLKTSLYVSLRVDGAEWIDVTVIHPRNHPSDIVIPLKDVLQQFVPGGIGEVEIQIVSTQNHYLDFVGLDNSVPTPVNVQEAPLVSAMLNGVEDVTDILLEGNGDMVTIVPGEHIILTFEIPWQRPGQAFRVRNFMLFSRGYYHLYEGENTAAGSAITVQSARNNHLYKGGRTPPLCTFLIDIEERFNMR